MTAFLPEGAAVSGPEGSGWIEDTRDDGSGALRADLAVIIAHPAMPPDERRFMPDDCDRCERAAATADALLAAGWSRVDPDQSLVDLILGEYPHMAHQLMRVHAEEMAAAIQAAGWVRVPADDDWDAIDEICRGVRDREGVSFDRREAERPEGQRAHLVPWHELPEQTKDWYRERIDGVLAALRGGDQR